MTNRLQRNLGLVILTMFALACLAGVIGFTGSMAKGHAALGLLVSLTGIVIVVAMPVAEQAR